MKLEKIYSLDVDKQKKVDKIFNKLHKQSCMNWSINHSSSEYSVFVIWKNVKHNEKMIWKAKIIVNVHNLNKLIISDIYSTSLQSEIIVMIVSKNYISVVDVTAFFYYWRIKSEHQNKLTIILHRSQKIFNVTFMKFINSIVYVQQQLDNKFRDFQGFCRVYINDIIIVSTMLKKHMKHFDKIFSKFAELHINLAFNKFYIEFSDVKLLE